MRSPWAVSLLRRHLYRGEPRRIRLISALVCEQRTAKVCGDSFLAIPAKQQINVGATASLVRSKSQHGLRDHADPYLELSGEANEGLDPKNRSEGEGTEGKDLVVRQG